ncbi:hypothetical protein JMJ58_17275 [Haloterrigena salifodinae]|uniref:Uncharacterized protein n=1 Tax=Haloterrigena salifodinae TaxID=2675099 RepID=A0A8T8DZQ4_9EURY|nr:hypothetical protein [Haloterrigena salifodinae]QRV14660.1 hypothetical protein JMJ58_17275 [Haloterrigena salifodinae]
MSFLSAVRSKNYSDLLTFGRSKPRVLAIVAGETIFLEVSFLVASPPYLPVPVESSTALLLIGALALFLAIILYSLLSGLGYRTYSTKYHDPISILKCWIAYLAFSATLVYISYLFLVFPYSENIIPKPVDIGLGAIFSTSYAIVIVSTIYTEDRFSDDSTPKHEDITMFLSAADSLRHKPESEIIDQPDIFVKAGKNILRGLQVSDLEDTSKLAEELQDWLDTFENRELQGQKKMVGDLPDSNTRFDIWDERYEKFKDVREEIEKMDKPATHKVLLSIRSRKP